MTKGYITIAIEKEQAYKNAKALALSYHLNGYRNAKRRLPFAVITDRRGAPKLRHFFDKVICIKREQWEGFPFKDESVQVFSLG